MTLILTCLTNDVIYQISDRRLTSFSPPRAPIDEESNKAVFVNGRVVFGYTGISQVNGQRTDDWLAHAVASAASQDMAEVANAIKDEASSAFRRMSFASRFKRHAFQGAGWFTNPDGPGLRPGVLTIHNALDSETREWLPYAEGEFRLISEFHKLKQNQFVLTSVGLRPTAVERSAVYQLIRKCVHRRRGRQNGILYALIVSMRWLSERYEPNSPIGRNLMVVSLPKVAAEQYAQTGQFMALASAPDPNMVTFLDIPEHGRPVNYGPHFVIGGAIVSGFQCGPTEANAPTPTPT